MLLPLSDTLELCLMLGKGMNDSDLGRKVADLHCQFEKIDYLDFSEVTLPVTTLERDWLIVMSDNKEILERRAVLTNKIAIRILPFFPFLQTLNISGEGGKLLTYEIFPYFAKLTGPKKLIASTDLVVKSMDVDGDGVNLFKYIPQLKELEILPRVDEVLLNQLKYDCPHLTITYSKMDECSIA